MVKQAEARADWALCIKLCRRLLDERLSEDGPESYALRLKLVNSLLKEKPEDTANQEEAIEILKGLSEEQSPGSRKRHLINMFLARVFFDRKKGDRISNLSTCVYHYQMALPGFAESDPKLWGSIQVQLAFAHIRLSELGQLNHLGCATSNIEQAMTVFRKDSDPEEWQDITWALGRIEAGSS